MYLNYDIHVNCNTFQLVREGDVSKSKLDVFSNVATVIKIKGECTLNQSNAETFVDRVAMNNISNSGNLATSTKFKKFSG